MGRRFYLGIFMHAYRYLYACICIFIMHAYAQPIHAYAQPIHAYMYAICMHMHTNMHAYA